MTDIDTSGLNNAWANLQNSSKQAQQSATAVENWVTRNQQQRELAKYHRQAQHMKQILGIQGNQGLVGDTGVQGTFGIGTQMSGASGYPLGANSYATVATQQDSIQHRETENKKPKLKSYLEGLLDD